ncbi:uncharacterized protein PV09_01076 [Verruconis gallopava]|uniref:L-ornithine N(5)-monooxygenase [NAD(P)H] n=1 Tax=Verruconis gallopava TaxID=253628 RepID=A0A0D2BA38_9PEZI|nr:uncharacterized protein PV09_01076 [Verruconis gallopava]KIW08144.1 hypothetical protein PV09_01076 [Verruconis gallopava]
MSPYAIHSTNFEEVHVNGSGGYSNGANAEFFLDNFEKGNRSYLQPTDENELHDLVCVGFGPASLAIAIALHDSLEKEGLGSSENGPKVAFLEQQPRFAWHAGMLLEGSKMQISFIKDMATLRNPRSSFTFLNYLHTKGRLVQFSNLDTFLPLRIEFEDYLRWCAEWFDDVAHYNQEVLEVRPEKSWKGTQQIDSFAVVSRNKHTGAISTRKAKYVVLAAGGRPNIPRLFPEQHPRLLHSSKFAYQIQNMLPERNAPYKIAVVGGGQSAAEIFNNLHSRYPNCHTRLILKSFALKPSDDSPFVNEIFDPDRVQPFFNQPAEKRAAMILNNRLTNYGVVRLELIEHLYETLYMQRLVQPDEERWQHRILNNSNIVAVDAETSERLTLQIERDGQLTGHDFDAVILATGYARDMHEDFLAPARYLMPGGDAPGKTWEVERDYRVIFEEGAISSDAGVFLQGCCESTHGLADSLLSILAVRGGEIVQSIFGNKFSRDARIGQFDSITGEPTLAVKPIY